jgi:ABC-type transport system involved in multi-copper enzyme maturation permease subunit
MLGTLIKTQFLDNIFGIKFIVTFIVCAALVIATTITGLGRYEGQIRENRDVDRMNRQTVKLADNWHSVARTGIKVVKNATWLGVFSTGLEESVGRTATVKEGDFPYMEDSIYSTAPIFAVFGDLDLTFIIKIVISLFAILFTYDIISGEKERGTLRLCLSNSVPRNTFILGKSIGSFLSLLLPLIIPLLISLILIMIFGDITFSGEDWIRLGAVVVGYILYLLAFFSLGIFVSSVTRHSAVSFLILLFLWVLLVLVVPKGAMMVAEQIHEVPDLNEVRAMQSDNQRKLWEEVRDNAFNEFMTKYGNTAQEGPQRWQLMRPLFTKWRTELEPVYDAINEKLITDFKRRQAEMTATAMNLSRVSPASAVTYIGMNISGTGYVEQENFLDKLTSYRERLTLFFENADEQQGRSGGPHGFGAGPRTQDISLDYNTIPGFEPTNLGFSEALVLTFPDLLTMALISIIFYALGFVLFLRYDVR